MPAASLLPNGGGCVTGGRPKPKLVMVGWLAPAKVDAV